MPKTSRRSAAQTSRQAKTKQAKAVRSTKAQKSAAAIAKPPKSAAALQALKTELNGRKVAIVCDWLTGTGGAERVVLELHRMFPDAPIYTSQYDKNPAIWYGDTWFKDADVRTSWLQHLPKRLKKFLPVLRAYTFGRFDLSQYDLVIASSGAEAKGVKVGPNTTLVWYCHAPTHYYWSRYNEYIKDPGFGSLDPLARLGLRLLVKPLRVWDHHAAQGPKYIVVNSSHIQSEVQKYYGRKSRVVHPPVDFSRFQKVAHEARASADRYGFVIAGRQTPYKRIDLAVAACTQLKLPLTVIGSGPEHNRLTAMAGPTIRFLPHVSDKEIVQHFQKAGGFIFPGVDDFGIVAVEAMSAGTPVIAYKAGGALDYIEEGKTGMFFKEQTVESLVATLQQFSPSKFNSSAIMRAATKYDTDHFVSNMSRVLRSYLGTSATKPKTKASKMKPNLHEALPES